MPLVYTISSIPEIRSLPVTLRRSIIRRCVLQPGVLGMAGTAFAMLLVSAAVGLWGLLGMLRGTLGPYSMLAAGIALGLMIFLALHQFATRMIRVSVRSFLSANLSRGRAKTCLNCGYDQRGSTGRHCPECGAATSIGLRKAA